MLTPIEIQDKSFKSGIGYDKKDVDAFLNDILTNYELLYTKNAELEDKVAVLSEGISHYKANEKSIQKALVLAQNVADEIVATANKKAKAIEEKAYAKSDAILVNSKSELNKLNAKIADLTMKFENYKNSCKHFAMAQIEMLDNDLLTPISPVVASATTDVTQAKEEVKIEEQATLNNTSTTFKVNEKEDKENNNSEDIYSSIITDEPANKSQENYDEDFTVNINFDDFDETEKNDSKNDSKNEENILSFDNKFAKVDKKKAVDNSSELADEFNIGVTFAENTKYTPGDSISYYEEQVSEKEDRIIKESGIDGLNDDFEFDDNDDDSDSIGIDFDFLNTHK